MGYLLISVAIWFFVFFSTSKITQLFYRKSWVGYGREDRREGRRRFEAKHKWIQRYYDIGYYEVDKRNG